MISVTFEINTKRKLKHHLNLILTTSIFLLFTQEYIAQEIKFVAASKIDSENIIISKINYKKKHKNYASVLLENEKISEHLKNNGYLLLTNDSVIKKNATYISYFSLNQKIDTIELNIENKTSIYVKEYNPFRNKIKIPILELKKLMSGISKKLAQEGSVFSEVKLENIAIKNKRLFAKLNVKRSEKRIINKTIIKGYKEFPTSFLKNYYSLNNKAFFNEEKISEISKLTKNLNFVEEIKKPEILFKEDSTLLYIYVKKKKNNSFDALVNFASEENGDILFNGNIDLKLSNILNSGENLELFWNSIGLERQEFKFKIEKPYIFNSKISPEAVFSIYKQDSSFVNTKLETSFNYSLNNKNRIALNYSSESSNNLIEADNNIISYSNYFIGLSYEYKIPSNNLFLNNKLFINIKPSFGNRKSNDTNTQQFKVIASASYIYEINTKNNIYIKNETGYLDTGLVLNNELFRIGGANSIRGFNEQSIFTEKFTFFNTEYRYLTSKTSYLYSLFDFGQFKSNKKNNSLLSLGFGYLFSTSNYKINIATAIGKVGSEKFDFKNSKLIISWINYF